MTVINISLDTATAGAKDARVLKALADALSNITPEAPAYVPEVAASEGNTDEAPETPKRTRRTRAQIEADNAKAAAEAAKDEEPEDAPEPEADDEDDDLLGGGAPTLEDAVAKATELVSTGKSAVVKAALAEAKAKRVNELKGDQIQKFLDAL